MADETTPQTTEPAPETSNGESVPLKPEATTDETAAPEAEPPAENPFPTDPAQRTELLRNTLRRVARLEVALAELIEDPKRLSADPDLLAKVGEILRT